MNDARFDAELDAALIGGREKRAIVVVPYDPAWPERFSEQQRRISEALGPTAQSIHHIGSTAIEGLAAKPVIDIVVEVPEPDREDTYVPPLERAGYVLRVREADHRMLRTPDRDVHVHVWSDPADTRRHLLFRDWLRQSSEDRERYATHKRELARREWDDVNYYARAKGPLIDEIMHRAEVWAASTGWLGGPDGLRIRGEGSYVRGVAWDVYTAQHRRSIMRMACAECGCVVDNGGVVERCGKPDCCCGAPPVDEPHQHEPTPRPILMLLPQGS